MADEIGEAFVRIRPDSTGFREEAQGKVGGALGGLARTAGSIAIGYGAFRGLQFGYDAAIKFNAQLQQTHTAFTTILGSSSEATQAIKQLNTFAAQTPFEFQDIIPVAQQLLGTGTKLNTLIPIMTNLGNAVSATGGSADQLKLLTLAYTQLATSGTAHLQDLMQVNNAVPGSMARIAAAMNMTIGQFRTAVSAGQVTSTEATDAIQKGFDKAFGGGMVAQSHTFSGAMSTIHDVLQMTIATAFRPFFNVVASGADNLATFLQSNEAQRWSQNISNALSGATTDFGNFVKRIANAPDLKARIGVVFSGVGGQVDRIYQAIHDELLGSSGHVQRIVLPMGRVMDIQSGGSQGIVQNLMRTFEQTNWSGVATSMIRGIEVAVTTSGNAIGSIINALGTILVAHSSDITAFVLQFGVNMVSDLLNPVFWIQHWRLLVDTLLLALTVAMPGVGRIARAFPIIGRFVPIFEDLGRFMLRTAGDVAGAFLRGLARGIEREIGVAEGASGKLAVGIISRIRGLPQDGLDIVSRFGDRIARALGQIAGDSFSWAKRIGLRILLGLESDVERSPGVISRLIGRIPERLNALAVDFYQTALRLGQRIVHGVIDGIGNLGGALKGKVEGLVKSGLDRLNPFSPVEHGGELYIATPIIQGTIDALSQNGTGLGDQMTRAMTPAIRNATNMMQRFSHGQATDIGQSVTSGVRSGVSDLGGMLGDQIVSAAHAAIAHARGALGIHSPSSVFAEQIGRPMAEGIIHGLGGLEQGLVQRIASASQTAFGGGSGPAGSAATGANQRIGYQMMLASGWGADQWGALQALWTRESGWNQYARNPSSGAFGIPQELGHAVSGAYLAGDVRAQIAWGLEYIRARYGSPAAAWAHEMSAGWYQHGGVQHGSPTEHYPAFLSGGEVVFTPEQMQVLGRRGISIGTVVVQSGDASGFVSELDAIARTL